MRGKDLGGIYLWHLLGITPAYAGKSDTVFSVLVRVQDHPRVCGEKVHIGVKHPVQPGSPPRMRGKAKSEGKIFCVFGITPAYAGTSRLRWSAPPDSRDHPRVCGEKLKETQEEIQHTGSPPRMRGKVFYSSYFAFGRGITPAYAGKSEKSADGLICARDHPRVCGEKHHRCHPLPRPRGSPPRMRGKALRTGQRPRACGITPAYAGKSYSLALFLGLHRDHPRVCGEKPLSLLTTRWCLGSPPRMRGKVCGLGACKAHIGITPAYAGKS